MRLKSAQTAEMARKRPEIRFSLQKTVRFGRINVETNPAAFAFYGVPIFFRLAPFNQRFPKGTHASALIYSLVETAKANGQEPYAWLRYVLERLPLANNADDLEALLPWNCGPIAIY